MAAVSYVSPPGWFQAKAKHTVYCASSWEQFLQAVSSWSLILWGWSGNLFLFFHEREREKKGGCCFSPQHSDTRYPTCLTRGHACCQLCRIISQDTEKWMRQLTPGGLVLSMLWGEWREAGHHYNRWKQRSAGSRSLGEAIIERIEWERKFNFLAGHC